MGVFFYVLKRVTISLAVLIVASFCVYAFIRATVDPTRELRSRDKSLRIELRKNLHLDEPIHKQYVRWAGNAITGDLGVGDIDHESVSTKIARALPRTLEVCFWGLVLAMIFGISSGVFSAIRKDKPSDYIISSLSSLGIALSVVFFAYMLIEFFTVTFPHFLGRTEPIFYINGNVEGSFGQGPGGGWSLESINEYIRRLAMPVMTLSVQLIAGWSRYQRSFMIESLQSDYIRTAHAKGMRKSRVYMRHALRNAELPMVNIVALDVAGLFGGLIITEKIFGISGMGDLFITSLNNGDATTLVSWTLLTACAVVVGNLLADLIVPLVDPRVRTQ